LPAATDTKHQRTTKKKKVAETIGLRREKANYQNNEPNLDDVLVSLPKKKKESAKELSCDRKGANYLKVLIAVKQFHPVPSKRLCYRKSDENGEPEENRVCRGVRAE